MLETKWKGKGKCCQNWASWKHLWKTEKEDEGCEKDGCHLLKEQQALVLHSDNKLHKPLASVSSKPEAYKTLSKLESSHSLKCCIHILYATSLWCKGLNKKPEKVLQILNEQFQCSLHLTNAWAWNVCASRYATSPPQDQRSDTLPSPVTYWVTELLLRWLYTI